MAPQLSARTLTAWVLTRATLDQGLGDAGRRALRNEKGNRRLGAAVAGDHVHRIWVDSTEFRVLAHSAAVSKWTLVTASSAPLCAQRRREDRAGGRLR
jgi:hypothetical protein